MRLLIISSVLALTAGAAVAQQADRYTMEKTDDGYIRLNTQTGEMTICRELGAQLMCQRADDPVLPDNRRALNVDPRDADDEIGRLEDKVANLEKRLAALEANKTTDLSLPSDEEMDKTVEFMQKFFRGFGEIVKELDNDLKDPKEAPAPVPNRT